MKHLIFFPFLVITASGSALHGPCERNENCGTLDTYCKNGTCACKDDFVVLQDHCIQLATPHISCSHKSSCSTILGQKGFCKNRHCACKSFHHFFNNQCVKSKGLYEECDNDHQCYCGQDCNDKIECAEGICACKKGFIMYGLRCARDPNIPLEETTTISSDSVMSRCFTKGLLIVTYFLINLYYLC